MELKSWEGVLQSYDEDTSVLVVCVSYSHEFNYLKVVSKIWEEENSKANMNLNILKSQWFSSRVTENHLKCVKRNSDSNKYSI